MTETTVVVKSRGDDIIRDSVTPLLREVQRRLRKPGEVLLGPIADSMRATEQGVFLSAGSSIGEPWAPLAESTLRKKAGASAMMLVESGTLWESLTVPGGDYAVAELVDNGLSLRFGTDDPVALFHQGGTVHMPQRPVLPDVWPQEDIDLWVETLTGFFLTGAY